MSYSEACYLFSEYYQMAKKKSFIKDKVKWALLEVLKEIERR